MSLYSTCESIEKVMGMNKRFLIFILIVVAIVTALVVFELGRTNPWDSDVFFSQINSNSIQITSAKQNSA